MGPEPAQTAPSASRAPDAAATQLMPTVTRTPEVRRAIPSRPYGRSPAGRPTALPALGRDGGVEQVPSSARATVDRRRRAAALAAGLDPDDLDPHDHDDLRPRRPRRPGRRPDDLAAARRRPGPRR